MIDTMLGFSAYWLIPPVTIAIVFSLVGLFVGHIKGVKIAFFYIIGIYLIGAVRGIIFKKMSGRGCPTLTGDSAATYGYVLLVCIVLMLAAFFIKDIIRITSKIFKA